MSQIRVNNLTFGYEGSFDNVFENVSFSIDTNWKLGFIGRNGKGKTTFLNLLLDKYSFQGSITASTKFDYFPYKITDEQNKMSVAEFMEDLKPGCEIWKVICELDELSESSEILYRPYCTLSPGERTKALLAILFSEENEFLLIDEPTNHLDKEARECVKSYLATKKGFILVSHDRDLLDACTDHCLVLNRCTIEVQNGNFSVWWENKQRKDKFAVAENEIIGIITIGAERDGDMPEGTGELCGFYFDPDYIGKGFGRQAMDWVKSELKARGFLTMVLWVLDKNDRAKYFYEKAGLRPEGAIKSSGLEDRLEERYIMKL